MLRQLADAYVPNATSLFPKKNGQLSGGSYEQDIEARRRRDDLSHFV